MLEIEVKIVPNRWEVTNNVKQLAPLSTEHREFYYEIIRNLNEHAFCDLTNKELACSLNKSVKEIKQFLKCLKKKKYIFVFESKHKRMIYPLAVC